MKLKLSIATNLVITLMMSGIFTFAFFSSSIFASAPDEIGAIYQGNISKPQISLMINVYWGTEHVLPMLEVLNSHNAKATFFVGGSWVAKNDDVLQAIANSGNEIGNHGFNHSDHKRLSLEQNITEIKATHDLVLQHTGIAMTLFAPPSGAFGNHTLQAAHSLGYKTIMWTRDTIDWRDKNKAIILNRAIKNAQSGDLILMHPIEQTFQALPEIIINLQRKGFELVTVSQNLAK